MVELGKQVRVNNRDVEASRRQFGHVVPSPVAAVYVHIELLGGKISEVLRQRVDRVISLPRKFDSEPDLPQRSLSANPY